MGKKLHLYFTQQVAQKNQESEVCVANYWTTRVTATNLLSWGLVSVNDNVSKLPKPLSSGRTERDSTCHLY
jgi:hypothetical protein